MKETLGRRFGRAAALTVLAAGSTSPLPGVYLFDQPEITSMSVDADGIPVMNVPDHARTYSKVPDAIDAARASAVKLTIDGQATQYLNTDGTLVDIEYPEGKVGSGSVIRTSEGVFVSTADHVMDNAKKCGDAKVGYESPGYMPGVERVTKYANIPTRLGDMALLQVAPGIMTDISDVPPLKTTDPDHIQRGQSVFAVGYQPAKVGGELVDRGPMQDDELRAPVVIGGIVMAKYGNRAFILNSLPPTYDPVSRQRNVIKGMSGGPLMTAEAEWAGVITHRRLPESQQAIESRFGVRIIDADNKPDTKYSWSIAFLPSESQLKGLADQALRAPECASTPDKMVPIEAKGS